MSHDGQFASNGSVLKTLQNDEQILVISDELGINRDIVPSVGVKGWAHDNSSIYLALHRKCIAERVGIMVFPWTTDICGPGGTIVKLNVPEAYR